MNLDPTSFDDKNDGSSDEPRGGFFRSLRRFYLKAPILFTLFLMAIFGFCAFLFSVWFIDFWTMHGQEEVVPKLTGKNIAVVDSIIKKHNLKIEVVDSIFDTTMVAGTIIDQNPHPKSRVKRGRTVQVTIVAFSEKMVSFPEIVNMSLRQGESVLEGIGVRNVVVKRIPAEFADLILGAKMKGKTIRPGQKIPVNALVTLLVGMGTDDDGETYVEEPTYSGYSGGGGGTYHEEEVEFLVDDDDDAAVFTVEPDEPAAEPASEE